MEIQIITPQIPHRESKIWVFGWYCHSPKGRSFVFNLVVRKLHDYDMTYQENGS